MAYRTKTQKKNALKAISSKAFKLYESGVLSMAQLDTVNSMMIRVGKKL